MYFSSTLKSIGEFMISENGQRIKDTLLKLLGNSNEQVRKSALESLINWKKILPWEHEYRNSSVPNEFIDILVNLALNDDSNYIRRVAVSELGILNEDGDNNPKIIDTLVESLKDKELVAYSFIFINSPIFINKIMKLLDDNIMDTSICLNVIGCLRHVYDFPQYHQEISDKMIELLNNNTINNTIRSIALECLGDLGYCTPKVISSLIKVVSTDTDNISCKAIDVLGQLGQDTPDVIELILNALNDTNIRIRTSAVKNAGTLLGQNNLEIINLLIKLTDDKDEDICEYAIRGLGNVEQNIIEVTNKLLQLLIVQCNIDYKNEKFYRIACIEGSLSTLGAKYSYVIDTILDSITKEENNPSLHLSYLVKCLKQIGKIINDQGQSND